MYNKTHKDLAMHLALLFVVLDPIKSKIFGVQN